MSENTPVQLIVAAYQDEDGAKNAVAELKKAKKEKLIAIKDAAVLRKDKKGKVHIVETADMGGGKGLAFGGVVGGAVGVIAGGALAGPMAIGAWRPSFGIPGLTTSDSNGSAAALPPDRLP